MRKNLIMHFLENVNGEASSKRLAGLSGWLLFLILGLVGGATFLYQGKSQDFIDLVQWIGLTSCIPLGVSVFEYFGKKKDEHN